MASVEIVKNAIMSFDKATTLRAVKDALSGGIAARQIFDGLVEAMKEIGQKFECMDVFLPEVMRAADAMKESFAILMPHMVDAHQAPEKVGTVVFGTVKGDMHNVGKDMVISVMLTNGFEVIDLGVNVPTSKFFEEAERHNADIVAMCAIMSSTIPLQKDIVDYFVEKGVRKKYKLLIGGGSTNPAWAEKIGADGWGKDAVEANAVALKLVGK